MAWSDAARAAALEARRHHAASHGFVGTASNKTLVHLRGGSLQSSSIRKKLAAEIRAMRKTPSSSKLMSLTRLQTMRDATMNAAYRNAQRKRK